MRNVNGAVAAITGAGSGIGRATAILLARRGAAVALSDVNRAGLEETIALLPPGAHATMKVVDVSHLDQVLDWARDVERHFGRTSIVLNNAGVGLYGMYEDYTRADLEWIMNVNFWGPVNGAQAFLPMLKEEPASNLLTVSSVYGIVADAAQVGYNSSKFGVRGFFEALRHELATTPVRVTVIHPGGVATNIAKLSRPAANADTTHKAEDVERFQKILRTTPDQAAALIVGAIERDAKRLLIGRDAVIVDAIARIFPQEYHAVLGRLRGTPDRAQEWAARKAARAAS